MKKQLAVILFLAISLQAISQGDKYEKAMRSAISVVDTCEAKASFILAGEKFDHISEISPGEWLPYYYRAFCDIHIAMLQKVPDSIEFYAGRADVALNRADSLSKGSSEVLCLKALNAIAKINVDYMSRALEYSGKAHQLLEKAEELDPANPRIYYLQGRFLYGRPKQFGGGKKAAKPYFEKAVQAFEKNNDMTSLQPHWGLKMASYLLDVCSKSED